MERGFFTLVTCMMILVFAVVITIFGVSAVLGYKCYTSGDPNNMACYMMSDRHEIGICNR